ncbi:MAG TPA: TrkA family potassium uptake protein [Candidatus Cloacimonadota bacterium]|jgi:trk system potassium uptake protein TrkA|nr:TrkA family potassium uptake protein [Candidatus Cloacimonadota bacterium]
MAKFAVIGLGKFGMTVATTLYKHGAEVIAIDNNQNLVDEAQSLVTSAYKVDCTDEIAIKQLQLHEMDAVILAIGQNIEVSILTSAILKKIGVAYIHAKADNKLHGKILEIIGVQNVVFPEEQIGMQLANTLLSRNIEKYVDLSTGHSIVELIAPKDYIGKSLQELALPSEKHINVIAIKSERMIVTEDGNNSVERRINDLPGANDIIQNGDVLILLGPKNRVNELIIETSK